MVGVVSRIVFLVVAVAWCGALVAAPPLPQQAADEPVAVERERTARLAVIARELQDPQVDAVALYTEAVRTLGFAIWSEDRTELAPPTGAPRLFLAVTDVEVRGFCELFRAGHTVARDDLFGAIDVLYGKLDLPGSATPAAVAWLRDGADAANPSARALHFFVDALGRQRAGAAGAIDQVDDFDLDPLQALLVLRVLTEDLGTPLRRHLATWGGGDAPRKGPWVGDRPMDFDDGPGWAEDAYVGGVTGLFGQVADGLGKLGKSVGDGLGKANAIASIAKFVLTYTYLKGETWVEDPGQPLVRTKDTSPGEQRTLAARFWIDGSRVTDWLKEHRKLVALAGLDVDMPRTGPLKGVETAWDLQQDRHSSKYHLVQTVRGQPDISKIATDADGAARIRVEGMPQPRKLDALKVMPIAKSVRVTVTPQIKSVEMQQDLVDAVTGAIGIRGGGVGLLTPVIECLYRMKWKGGRWFDLEVRDWSPAETIGQAEVWIEASGSDFGRNWSHRASVSRRARFVDLTMQPIGIEVPPELDPTVLAFLPQNVRDQMEAGRQQALAMAKKRLFLGQAPGRVTFEVHDAEYGRGVGDGCTSEDMQFSEMHDGSFAVELTEDDLTLGRAQLSIDCDLEHKTAKLTFTVSGEVTVVRRDQDGRGNPKVTTTKRDLGVFDGLALEEPWTVSELETPLHETPGAEPGIVNYYGVATVPFRFGLGDRFTGKAIVSWSAQRRLPKQ